MDRILELADRLNIAVDYAKAFRADDDPTCTEACEKAIRYANMLSQAILALTAINGHTHEWDYWDYRDGRSYLEEMPLREAIMFKCEKCDKTRALTDTEYQKWLDT